MKHKSGMFHEPELYPLTICFQKNKKGGGQVGRTRACVWVCTCERSDLPLNARSHGGCCGWRALFMLRDCGAHPARPRRHSMNGTACHMDNDTEQAVPFLATRARGDCPRLTPPGLWQLCWVCAEARRSRAGCYV